MPRRIQLNRNQKDLIRRYLIWCYKTTKEELDRIDRYFTQLKVDRFILSNLKSAKDYMAKPADPAYKRHVDGFLQYMLKKEENVLRKKFADKDSFKENPSYRYLHNRFLAIEKAIQYFLGAKELDKIRGLYEEEMTRRILKATEHT